MRSAPVGPSMYTIPYIVSTMLYPIAWLATTWRVAWGVGGVLGAGVGLLSLDPAMVAKPLSREIGHYSWGLPRVLLRGGVLGRDSGHRACLLRRAIVRHTVFPSVMNFVY